MLPRVYIETTFVSYLTARANRDVVIAGHQQSTKEWWDDCRRDFELCASEIVLQEAGAGDPQAAKERLDVLNDMILVETRQVARDLAKELLLAGALPEKAFEDALHIAVAADQKIPFY